MIEPDQSTRRAFIKSAAVAGATLAAGLPGCAPDRRDSGMTGRRPEPADTAFAPRREGLRVAFIGTGGMGGSHVGDIRKIEDEKKMGLTCPCFCDVDRREWVKVQELFPGAVGYQDYREMLDKEAANIDAVMIGIPDHQHYPATVLAMRLGKHVYTQKPLTHTPWEARQLAHAASKYNVVTQMGNQGHSWDGNRKVYEYIHGGLLGDIRETHTWTNRPVWPQGVARPENKDDVPAELDWDLWLGPAPERPYADKAYHRFNWRGWWDFGAGALGDMACHTMDCLFWSLDPGSPTSIEPLASTPIVPDNAPPDRKETFPTASIVKWEFPRDGSRRAFTSYWYDGQLRPEVPAVLKYGRRLPSTGSLLVGTKNTLLVGGDYGERPRLIPDERHKEVGDPPQILERSPGHIEEWIMACKGEKPIGFARSNFAYAGPFTETILLGNIALRVGQRLEWDAKNMAFPNLPEANVFVSKEYREGWNVGEA
jgi:predicted dehydrogenase